MPTLLLLDASGGVHSQFLEAVDTVVATLATSEPLETLGVCAVYSNRFAPLLPVSSALQVRSSWDTKTS